MHMCQVLLGMGLSLKAKIWWGPSARRATCEQPANAHPHLDLSIPNHLHRNPWGDAGP